MAYNRLINVISTNNTKPTWSRQAILSWCNKCLNCDIQKIDDLCTGAAYCCLMDILVPDCINLNKVKFKCFLENDYVNNLVLLQQCFKKLKVEKNIPIYKLVKGKFQDNYEFAVWFRLFFEANFQKLPEGYDVMLKRNYQIFIKDVSPSIAKIQRTQATVAISPKMPRERERERERDRSRSRSRSQSRTSEPIVKEPAVRVAPITAIAKARAIGGQSTDLDRH